MAAYPPPPPPYTPYSPYPRRPASESKAALSLALGILSFVTCGLTGIPAVILGFSARTDVERAGGAIGGGGMATAGIATGLAGSIASFLALLFVAVGFVVGLRGAPRHAPMARPTPSVHAPTTGVHAPPAPAMIGGLRVVDLDPDAKETFHQQLAAEYKRAAASKQMIVLMTSAKWCTVCREFEESLSDPRMQAALANVDLVRADIDDFDAELKSDGMLEPTLPWFYKLDGTLRPVDAISAGEWDENVPENMAPVLKAFIGGTLRARRNPSPMGTSL